MKWCNLYWLVIKLKSGITITFISGKALDIMSIASMTVLLSLTLEVDLGDIVVRLGDKY